MSDEAILKIVRMGIPSAGMPGFSKLFDDKQIVAVVQHLRALQRVGKDSGLPGDSAKGSELFFGSAGCSDCHMVRGRGGFIAADLTGYGGGHDARAIREAILSPNENFNPRHGTATVTLKTSKTYRGVIKNEDNFSLQIESTDGNLHLVDKADVIDLEREAKSLMPSDYGTKLTKLELDDLVSFLSSGSGSKKPDEEDEAQ